MSNVNLKPQVKPQVNLKIKCARYIVFFNYVTEKTLFHRNIKSWRHPLRGIL